MTTLPHDPAALALPPSTMLIGGDTVTTSSGGTYDHVFAGTGKVNATIPLAGPAEIDLAVAAARAAQREWVSWPAERRRDALLALADLVAEEFDEFARLTVHDYAPPISFAATTMLTERYLRYYAGFVDKATGSSTPASPYSHAAVLNLVEHEPYGVVLAILPWNGPMVPVGLAVAPALAAGNAVLVKPPELSPFAPFHFGQLCVRAGLPAGLVSILPAGPEGSELMVRHPAVDKIHFTGGGTTARAIIRAAAEHLTPVLTELGGKNPNVIFADADLDTAAQIAAFQGPLTQAGQSCACGSRIIVQESIYDAFLEKMLAAVSSAKIGDPWDPTTLVGPVVSQAAADRIMGVIDEAVDRRYGELVLGGRRLGGELADGFYIEPTVFSRVDNSSPLAQVETFGPVVSVIPFSDEADALAIANDSSYGLNSFVFTHDLKRAHRFARGLEAGSVWVNTHSDMQPQSPYGGYKQSGNGRVGGLEGLLDFLSQEHPDPARLTPRGDGASTARRWLGGLALRNAVAEHVVMSAETAPTSAPPDATRQPLTGITFRTSDGADDSLADHAGEVVLLVNVASKCGLTPQYAALQSLYEARRAEGFTVLAFPANDFLGQEPGTDAEIASFCSTEYAVTFPVLSKISVVGDQQHPLYAELTRSAPTAAGKSEFRDSLRANGLAPTDDPDVLWNFEKFLISRRGEVVGRFAPSVAPDDPELDRAIRTELDR